MFDLIYEFIEFMWITINSYPVVIQVTIYFISLSIFLVFIFLLSIFQTRRSKNLNERRIKERQPKMIRFFNEILESEKAYDKDEILVLFKSYFGGINAPQNKILIPSLERLIDKDDHLVYASNYKNLILALGIIEILEKNIDSANPEKRFKSIQSFSKLKLTISDSKILPHAYSKKPELLKEARASYVTISNNDPFKFFDEEYELNKWDQINLLYQFKKHRRSNLPNFGKWIKYSKNKSQILFFVKMITCFKQESSIDSLLELLHNDDVLIRAEAITAIGQLKYQKAESYLQPMYNTEPLVAQKKIIIAISHFKNAASLPFLENAYNSANNTELKKIIAEVIFLHGSGGKILFKKLKENEEGFNRLIFEHIENPLIPSGIDEYKCEEELKTKEKEKITTKKKELYGSVV